MRRLLVFKDEMGFLLKGDKNKKKLQDKVSFCCVLLTPPPAQK